MLAVKHALVAECYECFFDECSRGRSCCSIEFCVRRRRLRLHVAPTTRGDASGRGVADAGPWTRCCRAVRLLVVVSYLLSIVKVLTRLPRVSPLPPAGPGPSFVGANRGCLPRKASTCARLIDRVSRRRLQTGRSPRRAAAARGAAQRPRGRGPVQDHDAAKTTSRTGRRGAAAPRRHSRPPGPFWGQPGAGPGRAPPIKQSARARGYTVAHIASRRRRRRSPSRRGRAGRFHTSCRTAGLW